MGQQLSFGEIATIFPKRKFRNDVVVGKSCNLLLADFRNDGKQRGTTDEGSSIDTIGLVTSEFIPMCFVFGNEVVVCGDTIDIGNRRIEGL